MNALRLQPGDVIKVKAAIQDHDGDELEPGFYTIRRQEGDSLILGAESEGEGNVCFASEPDYTVSAAVLSTKLVEVVYRKVG